jgi:glycosyltransferase involved in cell wall biosynthesis
MEKIPCTVGILTFNSAVTLRRALESVKEFDDIVICDGGSSDDTLAIAREYGAHVILQDSVFKREDGSLKDYSGVRNQCVDAARYDWFLYIDSDERATPELVEEVRTIVSSVHVPHHVYKISPRIVLDERVIEHSSNYPGWQKRFFNKKSGARFRKAVHERITYDEVKYPAGFLKGHWHYFIASAPVSAEKLTRYVGAEARLYRTKNLQKLVVFISRKYMTILKVTLKILWNAMCYPTTSLPLELEWSRVRYQIMLVNSLLAYFFFGKQ